MRERKSDDYFPKQTIGIWIDGTNKEIEKWCFSCYFAFEIMRLILVIDIASNCFGLGILPNKVGLSFLYRMSGWITFISGSKEIGIPREMFRNDFSYGILYDSAPYKLLHLLEALHHNEKSIKTGLVIFNRFFSDTTALPRPLRYHQ